MAWISLALYYLDYETIKYGDVAGTASKQISFSKVEIDVATNYAAEDADITLRLFNKLEELLEDKPTQKSCLKILSIHLFMFFRMLNKMEQKLIKEKLAAHSEELAEKISDLSSQAFKIAGEEFNLDSPKQL